MFVRWGLGIGALLLAGLSWTLGCGIEVEDEGDETGQAVEAIKPKACPAIAIMCLEGYRVKQLPNCNQICVPDQGFECYDDDDCGAIYCLTTPCDQPICQGHDCVMPADHGGGSGSGQGGQPCGDVVCGANTYCCNASCNICAPLDGACIQIVCL